MAYSTTWFHRYCVSAVSVGFAVGCGAQAQSDAQTQNTGGGGSSGWAMTTLGGSSGVGGGSPTAPTGGTQSLVTTTLFSGGASSLSTTAIFSGGTSSTLLHTGGKAPTGGKTAAGGATAIGGKAPTGGKSSAGGAVGTGGKVAGGGASVGGKSAAGGASSGGASGLGGTKNVGGTSAVGGTSSSQGGSSAGDTSLTAFCTGSDAKVKYQGQEVKAPATYYTSNLAMNCCNSSGVNLHSRPSLGFDFAVEVIESVSPDITPGIYDVGATLYPFRVAVRKSTDTSTYGDGTTGTIEIISTFSYDKSGQIGFCVEVTDSTSELFGTQLFVPEVTISAYQDASRWQMFLLSDSTITPAAAAKQPLNALTLADNPLVTLRQIAYVDRTSSEFGFTPGQPYGSSMKSNVGQVGVPGLPFVVVADDVRIYLGSFYTSLSSYLPEGPIVVVDDIGTESFTIDPPATSSADPRFDARIVKVLTETGRLIP